MTVPGPLTRVQLSVSAPGGIGCPSSETVAVNVVLLGKVIDRFAPALTVGAVFATAATLTVRQEPLYLGQSVIDLDGPL